MCVCVEKEREGREDNKKDIFERRSSKLEVEVHSFCLILSFSERRCFKNVRVQRGCPRFVIFVVVKVSVVYLRNTAVGEKKGCTRV